MTYTCALNDIEFYAYHGLYAEEQIIGGRFIVTVLVTQERSHEDGLNDLNNLINYEWLYQTVSSIMKEKELLIEVVAKKILTAIQSHYPTATQIKVSITKPNPAGLFKSGAATVELSSH